jgi:hypothetical protein
MNEWMEGGRKKGKKEGRNYCYYNNYRRPG